jgi:hypothetical protein
MNLARYPVIFSTYPVSGRISGMSNRYLAGCRIAKKGRISSASLLLRMQRISGRITLPFFRISPIRPVTVFDFPPNIRPDTYSGYGYAVLLQNH